MHAITPTQILRISNGFKENHAKYADLFLSSVQAPFPELHTARDLDLEPSLDPHRNPEPHLGHVSPHTHLKRILPSL